MHAKLKNCHNVNVSCRKRDVCSMSQKAKKKSWKGRRAELNCKTNHVHIQKKRTKSINNNIHDYIYMCVLHGWIEKRREEKKKLERQKTHSRNTDKKSRTAHLVPKTNSYKCN